MSKQSYSLSPEQRQREIVRIFSQGLRRLAHSSIKSQDSLGNLENHEKISESSLTVLDVSPQLRLHVCNEKI